MNNENIIAAIEAVARHYWGTYQRPLLLSQLPKLLQKQLSADYKPVLGQASLKSFIKDNQSAARYCLVQHPNQHAKIGIVPADVDFAFVDETDAQVNKDLSKHDVEAFTRVLRSMTLEELRSLSLPAALVVKLLGAK
jgi:hypothetical protein